jgi:hypothetical protein
LICITLTSSTRGFAIELAESFPPPGALGVRPGTAIEIQLAPGESWNPETQVTLEGSLSGPHAAEVTYQQQANRLLIAPARLFQPGETVRLTIASSDAAAGATLAFRVATAPSPASFQLAERLAVRTAPNMLAAADLDGDGDVDLAVSDVMESDGIQVFLNDGFARFAALDPVVVPGLEDPSRFSVGDLDRDGLLDLIVAGESSASLIVLRGIGDGGFEPVSPRDLESGTPVQTASGDLDLDGQDEVLIAHLAESDSITIFQGAGEADGGLNGKRRMFAGHGVESLVLEDLDSDGDLDLAVANEEANQMVVFSNPGNGRLDPAGSWFAGRRPEAIVAGDLNGDGIADLATVNQGSNDVSVFLGRGDLDYQPPIGYAVGDRPFIPALADFEGDGDLDLAIPGLFSDDVTILLNRGDGTFVASESIAVDSGPVAIAAADFDGDGSLDLAVASSVADNVTIWRNAAARVSLEEKTTAAKNLGQNVPNPFNPVTQIAYKLDSPGHVKLAIFDTSGKIVRTLVDRHQAAGSYNEPWDGTSEAGEPLTSGIYFYRLTTKDRVELRRMTLLR